MKRAELTKTLLINAALDAIAQAGATTFTLDSVAKRAGVSKGALLHHFSTRSLLIEGVIQDRVNRFWHQVQDLILQDREPHGRVTRAYVKVITDREGALSPAWRGLGTAFVSDPSLMQMWRDTLRHSQSGIEAECAICTAACIARLSADSLWHCELFGSLRLTDEARERLVERMVEMTYPEAGEAYARKAA